MLRGGTQKTLPDVAQPGRVGKVCALYVLERFFTVVHSTLFVNLLLLVILTGSLDTRRWTCSRYWTEIGRAEGERAGREGDGGPAQAAPSPPCSPTRVGTALLHGVFACKLCACRGCCVLVEPAVCMCVSGVW